MSSRNRQSGRGAKTLLVDGLVVLGILASIGLICISALLNYRFGYAMAGSSDDRYLYGGAMGFADVVKALMPFMFGYALRNRDWTAAVAACLLFCVITANSFYAGIGLAAEHRIGSAGEKQKQITRREDLEAEKASAERRLSAIGDVKSSAELKAAVVAALAAPFAPGERTVQVHSEGCTRSMVATREACADIAKLQLGVAVAEEAEKLRDDARRLSRELAALGPTESTDAQLDVLERVLVWANTPVERGDIRAGVLLGLGLLIEIGSGLSLYAVTTPWRHRAEKTIKADNMDMVGDVVLYANDRLIPMERGRLTGHQVFVDYAAWCQRKKVVALREGVFIEQFIALASQLGIDFRQSGSNLMFIDTALGAEVETA